MSILKGESRWSLSRSTMSWWDNLYIRFTKGERLINFLVMYEGYMKSGDVGFTTILKNKIDVIEENSIWRRKWKEILNTHITTGVPLFGETAKNFPELFPEYVANVLSNIEKSKNTELLALTIKQLTSDNFLMVKVIANLLYPASIFVFLILGLALFGGDFIQSINAMYKEQSIPIPAIFEIYGNLYFAIKESVLSIIVLSLMFLIVPSLIIFSTEKQPYLWALKSYLMCNFPVLKTITKMKFNYHFLINYKIALLTTDKQRSSIFKFLIQSFSYNHYLKSELEGAKDRVVNKGARIYEIMGMDMNHFKKQSKLLGRVEAGKLSLFDKLNSIDKEPKRKDVLKRMNHSEYFYRDIYEIFYNTTKTGNDEETIDKTIPIYERKYDNFVEAIPGKVFALGLVSSGLLVLAVAFPIVFALFNYLGQLMAKAGTF